VLVLRVAPFVPTADSAKRLVYTSVDTSSPDRDYGECARNLQQVVSSASPSHFMSLKARVEYGTHEI
jgi:hypothetical protein